MSTAFAEEPDFEDGTNILVGTVFREKELCPRALPWYLPSESRAPANWREKWATLRARIERLIDECQPVACTLIQTRIPALGVDRKIDLKRYPGVFQTGSGLEGLPARLHAVDGRPLAGVFPIRNVKGEPMQAANGQPQAFRFGLSRYFILSASSSYQGDARPVPNPRFPELARDGTALLYELPAEIAVSVWENWSKGFSRARSGNEFLWLDALFELSWQSQPGSALSAPRYAKFENCSIGLVGDGLFPRLPRFENWPLLNSIPNDGGHPTAWQAKLADIARASVAAIDEVLERGSDTANVPQHARRERTRMPNHASSIRAKPMKTNKCDKVFVSYSHKDKKFLDELLAHLKPLERAGRVSVWSDKQIQPGSQWLDEVQKALASAKVAVLLVTKDFLASDFIHKEELGPLLKKAEIGGVAIRWVLVRDCNWKKTPLQAYQAAYSTEKPLAVMKEKRDSAWVAICGAIEAAATSP